MGGKRGIAQRKRRGNTKRTEDRTSYNTDRKSVHKTTQGVAGIDIDDHEGGNEQQIAEASGIEPGTNTPTSTIPDIDKTPVTVFIRADSSTVTEPNAKPLHLHSIPPIHTTLAHVSSYAKLFTLIDSHATIPTTLTTLYGLDLGEHKQAYLSFTDEHGARHTAPLSKYLFPDVLGDGKDAAGKLVEQWKAKVVNGQLEHTPWCNCARHEDVASARAKHGVEVVEVLKAEKVAEKCRELYALVGAQEKEKEKGKGKEGREGELEREIERLTVALARKTSLLEAYGIEEDEDESDEGDVSEYEE